MRHHAIEASRVLEPRRQAYVMQIRYEVYRLSQTTLGNTVRGGMCISDEHYNRMRMSPWQ